MTMLEALLAAYEAHCEEMAAKGDIPQQYPIFKINFLWENEGKYDYAGWNGV